MKLRKITLIAILSLFTLPFVACTDESEEIAPVSTNNQELETKGSAAGDQTDGSNRD